MTNQEIIALLIEIGEQIDSGEVLVDLKLLKDCSHINAMTPYSWKSAIARYPTEKLCSLLKGLTYVEEELSWMGGSVCGCIWILGALRSRGASIEDIDETLQNIYRKCFIYHEKEIPSLEIGKIVMQELIKLDHVAYLRFASVYLNFDDMSSLRKTIEDLEKYLSPEMKKLQKTLLDEE